MPSKKIICYALGGLILFGIASFVIPKVTKNITNKMYKNSIKKKNKEDDDWGPKLEKKMNK